MADDRKKTAKSETLTIRLDQKTRFMLEFMARLKGQSLTTVVERAIVDAADNARIGDYSDGETWRNFWHVSEGVRTIKIAADGRTYPNYEEEVMVDFTRTHWPFFYMSSRLDEFDVQFIDILWPRINEFIKIWNETKSTNYHAAGKAMQRAIEAAGIGAPVWPLPPERRPEPDDDIPF